MYEVILFDLDGTLVDSHKGIFDCLRYAFSVCGIVYEGDLEKFIGPPFVQSIPEFLNTDDYTTQKIIAAYRKKYAKTGVFETTLYRGIRPLLRSLEMKTVALATTKPRCFAEKILRQKRISGFFDYVGGASIDGSVVDKFQVLSEVLSVLRANRSKTVLVGDTIYDCLGAAEAGIDCVGVTYGFGSKVLLSANATATVDSVKELAEYLSEN